ncbi:hypothetical protein KI387_031222, partial [Taxus chinensis]
CSVAAVPPERMNEFISRARNYRNQRSEIPYATTLENWSNYTSKATPPNKTAPKMPILCNPVFEEALDEPLSCVDGPGASTPGVGLVCVGSPAEGEGAVPSSMGEEEGAGDEACGAVATTGAGDGDTASDLAGDGTGDVLGVGVGEAAGDWAIQNPVIPNTKTMYTTALNLPILLYLYPNNDTEEFKSFEDLFFPFVREKAKSSESEAE